MLSCGQLSFFTLPRSPGVGVRFRAMAESSPILSAEGLGKVYPGDVRALQDATMEVRSGEFISIIGRSGAGKSTLLRCLNRLIDPTEGTIRLDAQDVTRVHGARLRRVRQRVGMIFQQFGLVGRLTVLQNVMAGRLRFARTPSSHALTLVRRFSAEDREAALSRLELVGIGHLAYKRAADLSGGQQQRVAIARVLAQDPGVILADEPIASLDPRSAAVVMDTLAEVNARTGMPVVVNLHQVGVARRYSTRIVGMRDGSIVRDGPAGTLDDDAVAFIYGGSAEAQIEAKQPAETPPAEGVLA